MDPVVGLLWWVYGGGSYSGLLWYTTLAGPMVDDMVCPILGPTVGSYDGSYRMVGPTVDPYGGSYYMIR